MSYACIFVKFPAYRPPARLVNGDMTLLHVSFSEWSTHLVRYFSISYYSADTEFTLMYSAMPANYEHHWFQYDFMICIFFNTHHPLSIYPVVYSLLKLEKVSLCFALRWKMVLNGNIASFCVVVCCSIIKNLWYHCKRFNTIKIR